MVAGINLPMRMSGDEIAQHITQFVPRGGVRDGMIYLQLTRGVGSPRNHRYPSTATSTLLFYALPLPLPNEPGTGEGVKLLAVEDERWNRCWVKCIALTANVLASTASAPAAAWEATAPEARPAAAASARTWPRM